jgi:serine/threonine protein kinase
VALDPGTRLGVYEILSLLGRGGMGEVYRARDTKLGRDVALKILPATFTNDPDRLARFRREAQVLASLNHPHIAQIYGLDEVNGTQFLVLELVDGESLDKRLAGGQIPVDEALGIAKQIAEALEAAHEKGIIHRDLKPGNIALTQDGNVKVLDFGLAKATENAAGASLSVTNSPTITSPAMMTGVGVILGTAAYMSPEQAKGRPADTRSDVWAFGCVLYEMLTGKRTFDGTDVSDSLAYVLTREPEWTALPPGVPEDARRVLRRCLQKKRHLRLDSMHDVWLDLHDAAVAQEANDAQPVAKLRTSAGFAWTAAALLTIIAIVEGLWLRSRTLSTRPPPAEMRLDVSTPPTTDPLSLALSPDGQKIVFVAMSSDKPILWLRRLDGTSARPLRGTEYASMPFWAPDSHAVGYFANSRIEAIDVDSGSIQRITSFAIVPAGATWNADGVVLFPRVPDSPLFRTSVNGGIETPVRNLEPQQVGQRDPVFLPDGRHFLYYVAGDPRSRGVYVGELNGGGSSRLVDADSAAVYTSTGHVLFVRHGTLFAQPLDSERWQLTGSPRAIAENIAFGGAANATALSASAAGPIAYRTGSTGGRRQLVWFDRSGHRLSSVGDAGSYGPAYMSVSPEGQRIAVQRSVDGNVDIWVLNLDRAGAVRLTTNPLPEIAPVWSPRGDRIAFGRASGSGFDLYQLLIDGGEEPLLKSAESKQATDWSRDGRYVLYRALNAATGWDVWALPLGGDRKPFPLMQSPFDERDAQFSPDGKWVAYQANDSGRFEVYVQPFPAPGARIPISTAGGAQVRWRQDGKELFYIATDGALMAVSFDAAHVGKPAPLFLTHVGAFQDISLPHYIASSDGRRFLMDTVVEEDAAPVNVIVNWNPAPDRPIGPGR